MVLMPSPRSVMYVVICRAADFVNVLDPDIPYALGCLIRNLVAKPN